MIVETLTVGPMGCQCYVLAAGPGRRAVVVDPGGDAEEILAACSRQGLSIGRVLLTHGHIDHIMAVDVIRESGGASAAIHSADRLLYEGAAMQAAMFGLDGDPLRPVDGFLAHGNELEVDGFLIRVLHTPGHSPGSVSFHLPEEGVLLTGDTLFAGGVGRTDLWGGSWKKLQASLAVILELDPATRILPGHGQESTIGGELRGNPFLAETARA